jgi:anti-anti-sigma factor
MSPLNISASVPSESDKSMYFVGSDTIVVTIGAAGTADQFASAVETFGEATKNACRYLILDLTQVERINSDLLGLLLWAHGRLRMRGAELVLVRPSKATREILARSGLDFVLNLRDELPVAAA